MNYINTKLHFWVICETNCSDLLKIQEIMLILEIIYNQIYYSFSSPQVAETQTVERLEVTNLLKSSCR